MLTRVSQPCCKPLATLNADGAIAFFAEVLADRIHRGEQAALLKLAHFTEVEVGLQSRRPACCRHGGTPERPSGSKPACAS